MKTYSFFRTAFLLLCAIPVALQAQRPAVQTKYTADPAPMVYNDTVFLYTTHDEDDSQGFKMLDWLLYSSTDMVNWTDHGTVASLKSFKCGAKDHGHWAPQCFERNGKFYMYCPIHGQGIGVLVSDTPYGPFKDPIGKPLVWQKEHWEDIDPTVFVDDDGRAYQFYSSENNETMYISLLTDDYLKPSGRFTRNFVKESREAPAVFKYNGKYYMLSSGCTGWDPNVAEIAVADSIMGTWKTIGNPCTGPDADKTFYAQSTYVQPVIGKKDAYIAMFDRWKKKDLEDSRYVWLPVLVKDGKITIPWHEKWTLSIFDK